MSAVMQYTHEATGVVARWHGGEYIDLGYIQSAGEPGIDGDDFHAYDVINVWDHAAGCPRIPRTLEAFQREVDDHFADKYACCKVCGHFWSYPYDEEPSDCENCGGAIEVDLDEDDAEDMSEAIINREPTDDQIYNRSGVEGGIAYREPEPLDEHDERL